MQAYNKDIAKHLEELKQKHSEVIVTLVKQQEEKLELKQELESLQSQLDSVNRTLFLFI